MVLGVGNILTASQQKQLLALKSTSRTLDSVQLRLASGLKVNSPLDNPRNFFAARALNFRSSDLARLLDGIGQNLQVIKVAENGIRAAIQILDQAEAYLTEVETDIRNGLFDNGDPVISSTPPTGGDLTTTVNAILAANPEAITLGGGVIVHSYDTAGSFTFTTPDGVTEVDYLIVGGGGGGGGRHGGGGGGGGVVTNWGGAGTPHAVTGGSTYNVTVGDGGTFSQTTPTNQSVGTNGQASSFDGIIALGGGGGGSYTAKAPAGGGSGGGGGGVGPTTGGSGDGRAENRQPGAANQTDSVDGTGYGNSGGTGAGPGATASNTGGGGGGGAGAAGSAAAGQFGGDGGDGIQSDITGVNTFYGGGGGGGSGGGVAHTALGGLGGGGNGGSLGAAGTAGTDGTGGGGGGARSDGPGGSTATHGSDGGSGIVVIRYTVTGNLVPGTTIRLSDTLENKYSAILDQLDLLALDAGYRGTNLLDGDVMTTFFNEHRSSSLVSEGIVASSDGFGLEIDDFTSLEAVTLKIDEVREARNFLRSYSSSLANDLNIIATREISIGSMINTLKEGRDNLILADQNQEGARFLALQTRQLIQTSSFSARTISIADFL